METNKNNKGRYSLIGVLALIVSIALLGWTVYDLQLKNRPYLYIKPIMQEIYNYSLPNNPINSKVSLGITFKNEGNIPATDIKVAWKIADDYGPRPRPEEFYKETYGKFPDYNTIFPNETVNLPLYNPDISPATKKIIVNAKILYTGMNKKYWLFGPYKEYWYNYESEYVIVYNKDGTIKGWVLYYVHTNWDRKM